MQLALDVSLLRRDFSLDNVHSLPIVTNIAHSYSILDVKPVGTEMGDYSWVYGLVM